MLNEMVVNELQELQQEHQGFKVTDLESANWCLRKLQALKEQEIEFTELARKETERIKNWHNTEMLKLEQQSAFFNGLLTEYALQEKQNNPKFRISTPYGKVSFRKQQPKWNYEEEALLNSLKSSNLNNLIRIKEEVNKAELKKIATVWQNKVIIDGEFIEGIEVIEQPEVIKINVEV